MYIVIAFLLLVGSVHATIGGTTGCLLRQTCNTTSTTALASTNSASVTSGSTTTGGTASPCPLPLPLLPPNTTVVCSGGTWIVAGDLTGAVQIDRPSTELVVNGNVTLTGLTLTDGSYVTAGGTAEAGGELNITLSSVPPAGTTLVLVLQAANVTGNFSRVNVQVPSDCASVSATQQRSADSTQLGLLIDADVSSCDHSRRALIIGACVGGVLGAAVVAAVGVLLAVRCGLIGRTSYVFNDGGA